MNALVVYSHPVEGSFCSAMRDAAVRGLQDAGHVVTVIDLTSEGFDPVMSLEEWESYRSPVNTVPFALQSHVDALQSAQILVFVYPTWWGGIPALLKGWVERVMLPDVAFRFNQKGKVRPALTNIQRIVVLSTFGSPWLYVKFVNDNGRRILVRSMRLATSLRTRSVRMGLYAMDKADQADRAKFLVRIEKKMGTL